MLPVFLLRRWQRRLWQLRHTELIHPCSLNSRSSFSSSSRSSPASNQLNQPFSSHQQVRQSFIDYFVDRHSHKFVRSSPVKPPPGDTSLLFTNAGMNQFKPIFLAEEGKEDQIPSQFSGLKRAVNSQKCIRVGGKHCDLETVGADYTHHTFFEMLGNWSFNDYFKKDACQMAWTLLTEVYRIDPSRLVVTIFGGDASLGLPPDLETFEHWRSIGVPAHRILPLSSADNFWEMGTETGPCGICTELHYQLGPVDVECSDPRYPALLQANCYELWNIVFMQYLRQQEGTKLLRLPKNYVDTGMGLERLVALLQGAPGDNYRSDLFTPYFSALEKLAAGWPSYGGRLDSPVDTAYRVLADHSRMAAVAIADGVAPDDRGAGYLLRRVIRRAVNALREVEKAGSPLPVGITEAGLLVQLASKVAVHSLGEAFPELVEQSSKIATVVEEEVALYCSAALRNSPQLIRLGGLLQIELGSSSAENSRALEEKMVAVGGEIEKLRLEVENEQLPTVNQAAVERVRREFACLAEISGAGGKEVLLEEIAFQFGLASSVIRRRLDQLELSLLALETAVDRLQAQVIAQFEAEARRRIMAVSTSSESEISLLPVSNDCITGRSMDFFLLKVAADLFGTERPLAVLLRQIRHSSVDEVESIIVQLSVPATLLQDKENTSEFPSAQQWFDEAAKLLECASPKLAIFPIKSRKVKRQVRYRVKLAEEEVKSSSQWKAAEEALLRALQKVVAEKR